MLDDVLKDKIFESFSKYELQTHLAYLRKENWINVDKNGRYFLQGNAFIAIKFKIFAKRIQKRVITPDDLATREAWQSFIAGTAMGRVLNVVKRVNRKSARQCFMASQCVEGERSKDSDRVAVSLPYVMHTIGVSKATASRIRTRASKGGHISNERQFVLFTPLSHPKGIRCLRHKWPAIKGGIAEQFGAEYANKLIWKRGVIMEQMPNAVSLMFNFHRTFNYSMA